MPTLEPQIDRLIRTAIESRLLDVHTCTLGKVQSTDGKTADIQLPIRRPVLVEDDSTTYEELPVLPAVPIMWPAANGKSYPLDLQAGDTVMVFFTEDSTAEFWESGSTAEPGDLSRHAMSSSFCLPIARAVTPAADFAALASQVQTALSNIAQWLTLHTHPVSGALAGASETPPPTVPQVAATVTRAK